MPRDCDSMELGPEQVPLDSESQASNDKLSSRLDKSSRWPSLSLDTWLWEALSMAFSISCFIAILAILFVYNQHPSPQLSHGLKLNTIVSILATGSKSSLICVVSAAIGQLKWLWVQKKDRRKLYEIQAFDNASRGPLGSIVILFSHKARSIVCMGAAITILAMAFDPFMQQVISYPIIQRPSTSVVANAQKYTMIGAGLTLQTASAWYAAIWGSELGNYTYCPVETCTWPLYDSVSWCSQCEDVTSTAILHGCDVSSLKMDQSDQSTPCSISLPHGNGINSSIILEKYQHKNSSAMLIKLPHNLIWTVDQLGTRKGGVNPLSDFSYVGIKNPIHVSAHAVLEPVAVGHDPYSEPGMLGPQDGVNLSKVTQCALSFCAKTYDINFSNGQLTQDFPFVDYGEMFHTTNVTNDEYKIFWKSSDFSPTLSNSRAFAVHRDGNNTKFAFGVPDDALFRINDSLAGIDYSSWPDQDGSNSTDLGSWGYFGRAGSYSTTFSQTIVKELPWIMNRLAESFTLIVSDNLKNVHGTAFFTTTYVSVDWIWFSLPALVLVLSVIFFITAVVVNKAQKEELWKCSILPVFYHGLDDNLLEDDPYATVSRMEHAARSTDVRLEYSDEERRVMLQ